MQRYVKLLDMAIVNVKNDIKANYLTIINEIYLVVIAIYSNFV